MWAPGPCSKELSRLWWAFCSIGAMWLWQLRNEQIFQGVTRTAQEHIGYLWKKTLEQVQAVIEFEKRSTSSRLRGIRLQICLESIQGEMHDRPIDRQELLLSLRREEYRSEEGLYQVLGNFIVANS